VRSPIGLGHLRRRFARFKLCAHLLNLRWKAVPVRYEAVNAMLLNEFLKQHKKRRVTAEQN